MATQSCPRTTLARLLMERITVECGQLPFGLQSLVVDSRYTKSIRQKSLEENVVSMLLKKVYSHDVAKRRLHPFRNDR